MIYYKYDQNKRTYVDPETGTIYSSPIRRYAYREYKVVEETSRSIVLGINISVRHLRDEIKVPKKSSLKEYGFLTEEEKIEDIWIETNRYKIIEELRRTKNYITLKEVANLLNYKETI